jgi:hypothetical protein
MTRSSYKAYRVLLALVAVALIPNNAFACGACIDGMIVSAAPFLPFWIHIFILWLIGNAYFRERMLPAQRSKRRVGIIVGFCAVVSIFAMVSMFAPFVVVLIPLWLNSLQRELRKSIQLFEDPGTSKRHTWFLKGIVAAMLLTIAYAYLFMGDSPWPGFTVEEHGVEVSSFETHGSKVDTGH